MPDEKFGGNLYHWLTSGTAPHEAGTKAPALPELPPVQTPVTPETPVPATKAQTQAKPSAAPPVPIRPSDLKTKGRMTVDEIGAILKTASESGEGYFTPQEIEEARQLVNGSPADEAGLKQLEEFKNFLSNEIVRRKGQRKADQTAA
jgi:hypothetical protein